MLSIITVNIQAAALPRAQALLRWLDQRNDDAVIVTETSHGPGTTHLLHQCQAAGLVVLREPGVPGDRGCALISRHPIHTDPDLLAGISLPGRAVAGTLASDPPVTVIGVYVPSSDRAPAKVAKKQTFLATVLAALRTLPHRQERHLVVGGDYNVIGHDHQPRYRGFLGFEYDFLDTLTGELGLLDAHQHLHPGVQEHSWIGRGGNGYRFDYLHTSPTLAAAIRTCTYLHEPRETGLSDHAAVTLGLAVNPAPGTLQHTPLSTAGTLF